MFLLCSPNMQSLGLSLTTEILSIILQVLFRFYLGFPIPTDYLTVILLFYTDFSLTDFIQRIFRKRFDIFWWNLLIIIKLTQTFLDFNDLIPVAKNRHFSDFQRIVLSLKFSEFIDDRSVTKSAKFIFYFFSFKTLLKINLLSYIEQK